MLTIAVNGGANNDILIGSTGGDSCAAAMAMMALLAGPGADVLGGGTGNNVLIQG